MSFGMRLSPILARSAARRSRADEGLTVGENRALRLSHRSEVRPEDISREIGLLGIPMSRRGSTDIEPEERRRRTAGP